MQPAMQRRHDKTITVGMCVRHGYPCRSLITLALPLFILGRNHFHFLQIICTPQNQIDRRHSAMAWYICSLPPCRRRLRHLRAAMARRLLCRRPKDRSRPQDARQKPREVAHLTNPAARFRPRHPSSPNPHRRLPSVTANIIFSSGSASAEWPKSGAPRR